MLSLLLRQESMRFILWLFPNGEAFFVAAGTIVAALVYRSSVSEKRENRIKRLKNIEHALGDEILLNIDQLFTNKPENPLQFEAIDEVRRDFLADIDDQGLLDKYQKLYSAMKYYVKFVDINYRAEEPDRGTVVRQQELLIDIIKHFNSSFSPPESPHINSPNRYRDEVLIVYKQKNFQKWKHKIMSDMKKLFG